MKKIIQMAFALLVVSLAFAAMTLVVSTAIATPNASIEVVGGVTKDGSIYIIYSDGSVARVNDIRN